MEAATEALNGGDSDQNLEQFAEEIKMGGKLGVVIKAPNEPANPA
jgi:hypothetical protein